MGYDNTNSGALFKNDDKNDDHPSWPDYEGSIETKCSHCSKNSQFWLSAWVKIAGDKAKNPGSKFFSIAATWKGVPQQSTADYDKGLKKSKDNPHSIKEGDEDFDDIPF